MDSEARIRSETALVAEKAEQLSNKLNDKENELHSLDKHISSLTNSLGNDFANVKSDYDSVVSNINALNDKLRNIKISAEKVDIKSQINALNQKRTELSAKLKQLAPQQSQYNQLVSLQRQRQQLANLVSDTRNQYEQTVKQENQLSYELMQVNRAILQQYNAPKIANNLADTEKFTTIRRSDMADPTVFKLVETDPSESSSNDVATKPIDGAETETNFIAQNDREYTATFYLMGKDLADCNAQYQKLYDWSYQYEFVVDGFSHWEHALITSISKSTDSGSAGNGLIVTITFSYARQAQIKYMRRKPAVKHKAPSKKHKSKKRKRRYIRVKPGMTYWQISRKTGVSLSKIMKMNRWKATALPVGVKVRYK